MVGKDFGKTKLGVSWGRNIPAERRVVALISWGIRGQSVLLIKTQNLHLMIFRLLTSLNSFLFNNGVMKTSAKSPPFNTGSIFRDMRFGSVQGFSSAPAVRCLHNMPGVELAQGRRSRFSLFLGEGRYRGKT